MRVLIINTFYPPIEVGGAERSTGELAEQLAQDGFEVSVASLAPKNSTEPYFSIRNGVRVYRRKTSSVAPYFLKGSSRLAILRKLTWHMLENFRPAAILYLRRIVRQETPDVIHVNAPGAFGSSAWLVAKKIPRVYTLRDFYLICSSFRTFKNGQNCVSRCVTCTVIRAGVVAAARTSDQIVSISEATGRRHQQFGVFANRAINVVPNQPAEMVTQKRAPAKTVTYGYIGRVETYKGIWIALEAFRAVTEPSARFVVAGTGSDADMRRLRDWNDERIVVLGRVPAEQFYEQVDIVLVPSQWHESFGRVAAEAHLSGCAVIVSDLGGLPEAVHSASERSKVVVRRWDSPAAWAEAMLKLADYRSTGAQSESLQQRSRPSEDYGRIYRGVVR